MEPSLQISRSQMQAYRIRPSILIPGTWPSYVTRFSALINHVAPSMSSARKHSDVEWRTTIEPKLLYVTYKHHGPQSKRKRTQFIFKHCPSYNAMNLPYLPPTSSHSHVYFTIQIEPIYGVVSFTPAFCPEFTDIQGSRTSSSLPIAYIRIVGL
jgi:hypothetical protein